MKTNPMHAPPLLSRLSRRDCMKLISAGVISYSLSGWVEAIAADVAAHPQRRRACILLWMNGGPSQTDTFDLKPGHANGGPYKEIATNVPGIRISEHLPKIATWMDRMAIVRSMTSKEGDHGRASHLMRTGYLPVGPIEYPSMGALVARELGKDDSPLPNFVSIAPYRQFSPAAYAPGFLGPQYAPLIVGDASYVAQPARPGDYAKSLTVQDLQPPTEVDAKHNDARIDLLKEMDQAFAKTHPDAAPLAHLAAYDRAVRLVKTEGAKAFNLDEEPEALRDAYGRNLFGQGCLLARRLVERGVPFVEVTLGGFNGGSFGWDTHVENFNAVKALSGILDPAWSTLMEDLKSRGLLDSTLIVWMGEFGRTPKISPAKGREHYPNAYSTVLAGGGIKGGQVVGKTSADGTTIEERPVTVPDFLSTVCHALGINPDKQNESNVGRPIRIVDGKGKPIQEVLA